MIETSDSSGSAGGIKTPSPAAGPCLIRLGTRAAIWIGMGTALTTDPKGLAAGDWWDILANISRAKEIGKEELKKHGAGNHNNEGDAMRHAEWSRRMSEEIGPVTSWTAGMANEVKGVFKGQPWDEAMMDIKNNAEGRSAASEGRPVDRSKLQKKPKGGFQVTPPIRTKQVLVSEMKKNSYWLSHSFSPCGLAVFSMQ